MRIAHLITTFIAVLAAVLIPRCGAEANNSYSVRRSARSSPPISNNHLHEGNIYSNSNWASAPRIRESIRPEGGHNRMDCCPSILEMVEPEGGTLSNGEYVELFRNGEEKQRFYELSCVQGVESKPCKLVDRRFLNQSQCVQKYSYSYALVRENQEGDHKEKTNFPGVHKKDGWMMDYIKVRSGCACEVVTKGRHSHKRGERKQKRLQRLNQQSHQQQQHSPHQQPHHGRQQQSRA